MSSSHDVVIVGGGHNALVAAAYLARAGRSVRVLERRDRVGGAAVSERPFAGVEARLSRYAYLVSLMPRQIVGDLGLRLELRRRRVSSYTPVPGDPARGLLVGDDQPSPGPGWERFYATCAAVADAVRPSLTGPLPSRAQLRERAGEAAWDAVVARPIGELIEDCVHDDTARGVVLTDALIGTLAGAHDADLRQNRCLLYHVLAPWDVPVGGMGAVTAELERVARQAGADISCGAEVTGVGPGEVRWQEAAGREHLAACGHVLAGVAPSTLARLRGGDAPAGAPGCQLKVNLLLCRLPRLRDPAVSPETAFAGTFHVNEGYAQLDAARAAARAGRLPEPVPCEVYCHSLTDPSILGEAERAAGLQTLTCFALHMPFDVDRGAALEATLRSLDSVLAEPIMDCVARDADGRPCLEARTPRDLEDELGLPRGNIFHGDLQWPFAEDDRDAGSWGVETDEPRIRVCGAGARRGGGVSGIGGHNAAMALLTQRRRAPRG